MSAHVSLCSLVATRVKCRVLPFSLPLNHMSRGHPLHQASFLAKVGPQRATASSPCRDASLTVTELVERVNSSRHFAAQALTTAKEEENQKMSSISLLFSHHILSSKKMKAIHALSTNASITTLLKVGRPGLIILEGETESVASVVSEILVSSRHTRIVPIHFW